MISGIIKVEVTIDDIMEFTERYQMNGLLVAIDFQKAFDSINHDFMFKALSVFNFGPSLIRWIQVFYNFFFLIFFSFFLFFFHQLKDKLDQIKEKIYWQRKL